ncbi:SDR family NAD(P)-dependent oxidoreductase [Thalassococcus sp. BH17M4-6]|uniref:SDR family NAD(P)-dependent oxidoreductase n=1 Tax=Thalassococcus sp. BH17M4-6 TaxID=3413148 RepID=UPI003BD4FDC6
MTNRSVAIVGYAARLPGAPDVAAVWDALVGGTCAIRDIPPDRWAAARFLSDEEDAPGKTYVARAGLIDDVFAFDNAHFGVTPRDARQMDPQQRLLLETVATALDHAAIDPARQDRTRIGVFVGASSSDHSTLALEDPDTVGPSYMVGNTLSILSNRISFAWDLQGPSYSVDTACASGLFALDHARRAIAEGEIDTAIVAGVNALLSPLPFVGFSHARMLSKTGLCQAFSKDADGYVRAEGAVAFILRDENSARAQGDQIRSILVASGTNSDGRSPGISQPKSATQERLMAETCRRFGVTPDDLAFLEAHGTGTAIGDPEEAQAIGGAYGKRRSTPLPIGSAKSNFGHLEPASGLVGLLKAQLALEHQTIPASLHCAELNPNIDFDALGLSVVRETQPIPQRDKPWFAAVNSFGFGGANAHAILRQPTPVPTAGDQPLPRGLMLSASSQDALRALARRWADKAQGAGPHLASEIFAANTRLTRHRHRLCLRAGSAQGLTAALHAWLEREATSEAASGTARFDQGRVGFVFPGNGAQWAGMGRQAFLGDPVFRDSFQRTSDQFQALGLTSLVDRLMAPDLAASLDRSTVAQPLLFALQVALVDSLAAQGVTPHAVLGHSAGEYAAACAAGALSRENAVFAVFSRATALAELHGTGGMMALATSLDQAQALIADAGLAADIAADNADNNVTVSGSVDTLDRLRRLARQNRIAAKMLPIPYPYHSHLVQPFRDQLIRDMGVIDPADPSVDLYSGTLARKIAAADLTPDYWWTMTRGTVRFRKALREMLNDGIGLIVEISGRSVLRGNIASIAAQENRGVQVIASLEDKQTDVFTPGRCALDVLAHGGAVDETPLLGRHQPFVGTLPAYPFQRTEFRLSSDKGIDLFGQGAEHPLLGHRIAQNVDVWRTDLSVGRHGWLRDHRVGTDIVVPGAAIVEMLWSAAKELSGEAACALSDVEFLQPIMLKDTGQADVRVVHDAASRRLSVGLRAGPHWRTVAFATLTQAAAAAPARATARPVGPAEELYPRLADMGLNYGPAFALVTGLSVSGTNVSADLAQPGETTDGFTLNPFSLDAGLHALIALMPDQRQARPFVPGRIGRITCGPDAGIRRADIHLRRASDHGLCIDVTYYDGSDCLCVQLDEVWLRPFRAAPQHRPAFWDERLVPAKPCPDADLTRRATEAFLAGPADPDLGVIRQSIAGRVAYDRATAAEPSTWGAKRQIALDALEAMNLLSEDGDGQLTTRQTCPWPEIDELITLLVSSCPDATDTLNGILRHQSGDAPGDVGITRVATRVMSALSGHDARILVAGQLDPALFATLACGKAHVVVGAADSDAAQGFEIVLGANGIAPVATIADLAEGPTFDLVVVVDPGSGLPGPMRQSLMALVAPGGAIMALERSDDLFELLTAPEVPGPADSIANALKRRAFTVTQHVAPDEPSVSLLIGTAAQPQVTDDVQGDCPAALATLDGQSLGGDARLVILPEQADPLTTVVAQAEAFKQIDAATAPVWVVQSGLEGARSLRAWRRCIVNETGRDIRVASVSATTPPECVLRHLSTTPETELELHGSRALAPRLSKRLLEDLVDPAEHRYVLAQPHGLQLNDLSWRRDDRTPPVGNEVQIEVEAVGLNFRDVLWAQDLLPPDMLDGGFAGATLGMECSGTVVMSGPEATLQPGTPVLAFVPGAFASHVTVSEDTVMPATDAASLPAATSIPVPFLTALYGLEELARLQTGETVLIHGAAGGVGLAAVQIARRIGAEIIATAGRPAKRAFLKSLGVRHVLDSRTLEFETGVQELTRGRGVDVVLNSLADEALKRSLACLAPFGRFIELGKRDFLANTPLAMRVLRQNISFHAVDVDQLLKHRPDTARRLMASIVERMAAGEYEPLPTAVFPPEDVTGAFRRMQKSDHIGKIALRPKTPGPNVGKATQDLGTVWLVTGGSSGFGFATARWLASKGVGTLWLCSRSGELKPEQAQALTDLGATVRTVACDVSDPSAVAGLMAQIGADGPGLDGVAHCAAVYGDGLFGEADLDAVKARLGVKLGGAVHLDVQTRQFDLRHFWLYGSVAARFGNPGQADYAAANAALESLTDRRQADGLCGTTFAWGPIGDTGYLDRSPNVAEAISARTGGLMTTDQAFAHLESALEAGALPPTLTIAPVDWHSMLRGLPVRTDPLFSHLAKRLVAESDAARIDLKAMIRDLGEARAREKLIEIIRAEAAAIIQSAPSDIDIDRPLVDIGLDSLMGLNLKMAVEERLGHSLPPVSIGEGLTLRDIARDAIAHATGAADPAALRDQMIERHVTDPDAKDQLKQGRASA